MIRDLLISSPPPAPTADSSPTSPVRLPLPTPLAACAHQLPDCCQGRGQGTVPVLIHDFLFSDHLSLVS